MSEMQNIIGDSSTHTANETAPGGGFYRHRLTIRFTNGETLVYTVREALHAEDITAENRFAVISSYKCEVPEQCAEDLLINLNDVSYIRTEHVTDADLEREALEANKSHSDGKPDAAQPQRLAHIGFI